MSSEPCVATASFTTEFSMQRNSAGKSVKKTCQEDVRTISARSSALTRGQKEKTGLIRLSRLMLSPKEWNPPIQLLSFLLSDMVWSCRGIVSQPARTGGIAHVMAKN